MRVCFDVYPKLLMMMLLSMINHMGKYILKYVVDGLERTVAQSTVRDTRCSPS